MKRTIRFAAICAVGCVAALWSAAVSCAQEKNDVAATPKAGELVAASIELPAVKREGGRRGPETVDPSAAPQTLKYYVFQPTDESAKTDAGFPLMLMLHGAGERGDNLELLKKYGPVMYCSKAESAKDWKFFTVAPQCPTNGWWSETQLSVMIDKLCEIYPVDRDRVYVTGVSMGGFGTWALLAKYPEKIAAAAPICAGGDPNAAPKMATTPIWAFHGDKDPLVRLEQSQTMIDANKRAGNPDAKLTVYPGVGHDSWINAYAEADLYTWFLSKRLSQKPAKVEPLPEPEPVDEEPKAGELVPGAVKVPLLKRSGGPFGLEAIDETKTQTLKYLAFQPVDESEKTDAGFPLLIFLHGIGERGDDLNRLKIYGPTAICANPEKAKTWKFFTVAPQCFPDAWWSATQLSALIDEVCEKYPVDKDRVYVTGLSMGGFGTWALLAKCPEKIAAAAPICGGGDPNAAAKMATTPIWAFHGDKDPLVPFGMSQAMIDANKKAGNPEAKLTIYPGVEHDSWSRTYADEELYVWLLSKRLSGKPAKVEPVAVDENPRAGELVAASIELPSVVRARGAADKLDESQTQTLKYYVFRPVDESAKTDAGFPLMLFLHGSGERGENLELLKNYGPPQICSKADGAKTWKFFTVSPQCPRNVGWSAPQLSVMIDKLCEKYPIDKSRVYVTGVSMGGYGTWNLLAECPEKIAAAAPICGGGSVDAASKMAKTPIWAFHGDQDKAVPLGASQRMIDAVKAAGNEEAKLTIYPGVGHNSWINAYAEPELYEWLLSKKSGAK